MRTSDFVKMTLTLNMLFVHSCGNRTEMSSATARRAPKSNMGDVKTQVNVPVQVAKVDDSDVVSATPTPSVVASPSPSSKALETPAPTSQATVVPTATATPAATTSPTPVATSTPTPVASATPIPTSTPSPIPLTAPRTLEFGNLWSGGDDGTYFYLNLDTGRWMWENMNVYNPSYDGNACQDYVGFIGSIDITDGDGAVTNSKVNMDWRFNPRCSALPKEFIGNPVMPGTWGTFVNLQSVNVRNTTGGGTMTITQVGRTLRFQVYHSLSAEVTITFSH